MPNVLITGDIHIHNHRNDMRRVEDGLECLRWIYKTAAEKECEHILIAGDFLHNRFNLPTYAYSKACRIVAENRKIKTIFLLGNHDIYYEDNWDVHSLTPLQEWATVIDSPRMFEIAGVPVDFLPYTPTPSKYLKDWKNPSDVLIAHVAVAEAFLNMKYHTLSVEDISKDKEVINPMMFKPWKKTWLGHYHGGQKLSHNAEYVGSPMQLTYGEASQQKHVVIFNLETLATEYVVNDKSPKFHIIENPAEVEQVDVENSYIKFRCEEGAIESKFEFRKKLSKLGAREIEFEKQSIDVTEKAGAALTNIAALFSDKTKLIHQYVDSVEIAEHLDLELLKKTGLELIV